MFQCFNVSINVSMFLWDRNKFELSANISSIKGFKRFKQVIYIDQKKKSGLSIDPWGAP